MTNKIIQLKDVKKRFLSKPVLKGLSFEVCSGELIALLGCNGAGKTTTINILLGLEKPDEGHVSLFGYSPGDMRVKRQVGVTPQGTDFPEGLKVREVLAMVAAHYINPIPVETIIDRFYLSDIADQVTAGLSYGQKRRIAVALSFIGNPKLIFLDEPTTGLDVKSRHALWAVIKDYVSSGGTVVLTTHYLEEAENLASRVLVLDDGVIRAEGSVQDIISNSAMTSISFQAEQCPADLQYAANVQQKEGRFFLETANSDKLIRELVHKQINFQHLVVHESNLETAFLTMSHSGESQ